MMNKFITLAKIVAVFAVIGFLVWAVTRFDGCGPDIIEPIKPEDPVVALPPPPLIPRDGVVVVRPPDSTGNRAVDRLPVDNPRDVDEVVAIDSTVIAVLKPRNRWFPDIRGRETRIRVLEGDNTRIITTIQPAPIFEFTPRLSVGANFTVEAIQPSLGVEVLRIWALRTGVNLAYDTRLKQVDVGPEIGVQLRTNLFLSYGVHVNDSQHFIGLKYRF